MTDPSLVLVLGSASSTERVAAARRIRVLHVVLNLHQGGLERVLGDLLGTMDPHRFEQHVLAVQFLGHMSKGVEAHATLHVSDPLPRWSILWPSALAEQIGRIRPDIVHTHSGVWYKGSLAARMAGVPVLVHTDHGRQSPDPWSHRFVDGLSSRRTDAVIAVSDALGQQLRTTVVRHPSKVRVIRNGVDTERLRRGSDGAKIRSELGIVPHAPIIGSIGRLDPIKCFDVMLEAYAILLSEWTDRLVPELIIAGDGPERSRLENWIANHRLPAKVHLLGWRDDVAVLLDAFDIFTMSSRSEGTSIGLLEAMSVGVCPVVTNVGGNPAVLGEALRHRLCAPEDARSLSRAWKDALTDRDRLTYDGGLARQRVVDAFSLKRMVREHEDLYTELLLHVSKP